MEHEAGCDLIATSDEQGCDRGLRLTTCAAREAAAVNCGRGIFVRGAFGRRTATPVPVDCSRAMVYVHRMSRDEASAREQFFDYFRGRHQTATRSDIPHADKMVLLTASLDALANHWHTTSDPTTPPTKLSGSERMRLFLIQHAQHAAFSKVSAPLLRAESTTDDERVASNSSFPFARYRDDQVNEVATWRDDPDFAQLEPLFNKNKEDRKLLANYSYGGILYKSLRCEWVHEFLPGNGYVYTPENDELDDDEPYYIYVCNTQQFLFMVPVSFLARTVGRAIESFMREAEVRNILPFKR